MNSPTNISWLWSGGVFTPADSVPISDRGFRYGLALFESLPVIRGKSIFLTEHCERLRRACERSGLAASLPAAGEIGALLGGAGFDGLARIYATAGDGGPGALLANGRVFVFLEQREMPAMSAGDSYKLALHPGSYQPMFGGLKTANYWPNIAALQEARRRHFDEALLFDGNGILVSACMANVFVVTGGKIKTPPLECGARGGVMREWVMRRREVEEHRFTKDDLAAADEIFLTSSGLGVMPVSELEGRVLPSRATGGQLRVEYAREIDQITGSGQAL